MDAERRELMRQALLLVAGLSGGSALAACKTKAQTIDAGDAPTDAAAAKAPVEHAFQAPQREMLRAACARVLPTDADPGAEEANVIEYIDRELARPEYTKLKSAILAGTVALDRYASRLGGKKFVELSADEQTDIIEQVQNASDRGQDFVKFLVLLTLEGFGADPIYGGNQRGVGWKFIGYGPGNPDGSGTGGHEHH